MRNLVIDRDTTTPHLPPWEKTENMLLNKVVLDKPKEEYTSTELLQLATSKIESIEREMKVTEPQMKVKRTVGLEFTLKMHVTSLSMKQEWHLGNSVRHTLENAFPYFTLWNGSKNTSTMH